MENVKKLHPLHENRKSYYGKAVVEFNSGAGTISLYSYGTLVASIHIGASRRSVEVFGTHSQTTTRHIKEFLLQNGYKAETRAQIEADYMAREVTA